MKKIPFEQFLVELGTREGQKFNSCHGPEDGRFCSSPGGGSGAMGGGYEIAEGASLDAHYDWDKNCEKMPDSCGAITNYADSTFRKMNDALRKDKSLGKLSGDVTNIDKAFEDGPRVPNNMTVFRSVNKDLFGELNEGDSFVDKGFVSTTILKGGVEGFGKNTIEIRVSKGHKGLYISKLSPAEEGESEMLLPRGSSFKVISKQGSHIVVELQ